MDRQNDASKRPGCGRALSSARAATWVLMAAVLAAAPRAGAQQQPPTSDAFLQRQRALDEQVRAALDRELPAEQKVDFVWGWW